MSLLRRLTAQVPTVVLARRNVSRATTRSALAVLAIVIGVVAIGGIGVGGEAFKQDQLAAYEGFGGTATVTPVFRPGDPGGRTFDEQEINRIRQAAGSGEIVKTRSFNGLVNGPDGDPIVFASSTGIDDPSKFYEAKAGEIPENFDRTVVVGSGFADSNDVSVGDKLRLVGEIDKEYRVSAVLKEQGSGDPLRADRSVFVPNSQFDRETYDRLIIQANVQVAGIETVAENVRSELNGRRDTVSVTTSQSRKEQQEQQFELINQFLLGISGISLLVAAVTIANTMLMSAIEREGEIGVLRAVGYSKFAVVRLLVAEATLLGVLGVAIGAPVALGVGVVANELLVGNPLAFTETGLWYIGVGVAFGVLTALVGGLYPAWRAANKRPVEALG